MKTPPDDEMKCIVFAGPSIHGVPPKLLRSFIVLPPASCGDVMRAARAGASIIAIIDGFFENAPSVWHREILWALSQGVQVFGSSSMGALRAAEMWSFGMQGRGVIYRLYRCGAISDDDEVALLHGPAETGFIPLTEPMINVRVTLRKARRCGIITEDTEREMATISKSIFYKDRTYDRIFELAYNHAHLTSEVTCFAEALEQVRVDLKKRDAVFMLSRLRSFANPRVTVEFSRTTLWDSLEQHIIFNSLLDLTEH